MISWRSAHDGLIPHSKLAWCFLAKLVASATTAVGKHTVAIVLNGHLKIVFRQRTHELATFMLRIM